MTPSRRTILAATLSTPVLAAPAQAAVQDPILGVDIGSYPGDETMKALWERERRRFSGLYLTHWNPQTNAIHEDTGWIAKRKDLAKLGWGFLPTYMGRQPAAPPGSKTPAWPNPSAHEGAVNGKQAAALMLHAGFPIGSVVYLDVEFPINAQHPYVAYLRAWQKSVAAEGFYPGVYCSYLMVPWVKGLSKAVWMFEMPAGATIGLLEQTDAASILQYDPVSFPFGEIRDGAICTQYQQNRPIAGFPRDMQFDALNSLVADPSNLPSIVRALKVDVIDLTKF